MGSQEEERLLLEEQAAPEVRMYFQSPPFLGFVLVRFDSIRFDYTSIDFHADISNRNI